MSRRKPNPVIVADIRQAEGALAEIATIDRKVGEIEAQMNEAIDAAKARASQKSAPLRARRKELEDGVATFATLNKTEMFKDRKSLDLGFGTIGFRLSTQIVQMSKITKDMTLERLRQFGIREGIRIKEDVNKEAMQGWPDERLEMVGLKRRTTDAFYIEINREEVADTAA